MSPEICQGSPERQNYLCLRTTALQLVCKLEFMVSRRLVAKMFCFTHFAGWNLKEDIICDLMKAAFVVYWPVCLINQCMAQRLMIICIFETYPETTQTSSTLWEKQRSWMKDCLSAMTVITFASPVYQLTHFTIHYHPWHREIFCES